MLRIKMKFLINYLVANLYSLNKAFDFVSTFLFRPNLDFDYSCIYLIFIKIISFVSFILLFFKKEFTCPSSKKL